MGDIEIVESDKVVKIIAETILYGDMASEELAREFADEIHTMWNEAEGYIELEDVMYRLIFDITAEYRPDLKALEVISNTDSRKNYFRVEEYSPIHISWVDGINSNTGYMKYDNLKKGSTTAAHEFGHTIGLMHPNNLNLIGKGVPGIMYPRGTLVDREYQYDFNAMPGQKGGTMNPFNRKVTQEDIDLLNIPRLVKENKKFIGGFTSVFHPRHVEEIQA